MRQSLHKCLTAYLGEIADLRDEFFHVFGSGVHVIRQQGDRSRDLVQISDRDCVGDQEELHIEYHISRQRPICHPSIFLYPKQYEPLCEAAGLEPGERTVRAVCRCLIVDLAVYAIPSGQLNHVVNHNWTGADEIQPNPGVLHLAQKLAFVEDVMKHLVHYSN